MESRRTIRAALRTGDTLPAHVTGVGKALLATLTDDQLRQLYRDAPPRAVTDKSLASVGRLIEEMERPVRPVTRSTAARASRVSSPSAWRSACRNRACSRAWGWSVRRRPPARTGRNASPRS
ncbi:IclR family transcriptional regulator C-terminal domain-containing protein [Streptomyces sp. M19]